MLELFIRKKKIFIAIGIVIFIVFSYLTSQASQYTYSDNSPTVDGGFSNTGHQDFYTIGIDSMDGQFTSYFVKINTTTYPYLYFSLTQYDDQYFSVNATSVGISGIKINGGALQSNGPALLSSDGITADVEIVLDRPISNFKYYRLGFDSGDTSRQIIFKGYERPLGAWNEGYTVAHNGGTSSTVYNYRIYITPNGTTYTPLVPTMPNTTSTGQIITCDSNSGLFQYGLCNLAVYLFQPTTDVLGNWESLGDFLTTKPPLGYFYAVKNSIVTNISTTTTSTIEQPVLFQEGDIFNPFHIMRSAFVWILWIVFAFWVFNRIRHFEL